MKAVEGFTDGRLTDPELAGEKLFGKPGILVKVFAKDVILDAAVGELG